MIEQHHHSWSHKECHRQLTRAAIQTDTNEKIRHLSGQEALSKYTLSDNAKRSDLGTTSRQRLYSERRLHPFRSNHPPMDRPEDRLRQCRLGGGGGRFRPSISRTIPFERALTSRRMQSRYVSDMQSDHIQSPRESIKMRIDPGPDIACVAYSLVDLIHLSL